MTNLCEVSRQGLTEGVRKFIQVDNHRAPEVGTPERRLGVTYSTQAERTRRVPRGDGQESPDELTLRAEEVGTWKSCINVDHIEKERWVLHW